MTKRPWLLLATVLAALLTACGEDLKDPGAGAGAGGGSGGEARSVVVASANFPENVILAEIYAGALKAAGVDVTTKLNVGSREVLLPALERGDVSVLPEYSGALLEYLTKGTSKATDTAAQVREIRAALPSGLTVLEPSAAQDQETVTCTREVVDRHGLRSLEDLARVSRELTFGGPPELPRRDGFGLRGLKSVYGIEFERFRPLDVAGPLTVSALKSGKVDCANLFSTQSAIAVNGFVSLADPRQLIASQAVVPLIAEPAATPETTAALDRVSGKLTTRALEQMVRQVEIDKADAAAVAQEFLREQGLA
jgi:osmoprotectant transport system substrate-binding protein